MEFVILMIDTNNKKIDQRKALYFTKNVDFYFPASTLSLSKKPKWQIIQQTFYFPLWNVIIVVVDDDGLSSLRARFPTSSINYIC
jgi:hypothetical protein